MAITAKDVMTLRKKSGLGMMECKKALTETDGDMAAAEQWLREQLGAKMDGRSDRDANEGRIAVAVTEDGSKGAIVEIASETDFVAKNDDFVAVCNSVAAEAAKQDTGDASSNDAINKLIEDVRISTKENVSFKRGKVVGSGGTKIGSYAHHNGKLGALVEVEGEADDQLLADLCMQVVAAVPTPLGVVDEDVPADIVSRERDLATKEAIDSGKPANIAEKIVEGKMRKFFQDNTLLKQAFVKDDKKAVQDILPKGTTIRSFVRYELGA